MGCEHVSPRRADDRHGAHHVPALGRFRIRERESLAEGTTARNIMDYVDDALRYGTVTPTRPGAFTVEHSLGRTIGTNIDGDAARSMRVFVRDGVIQTAFPF